MSADLFAAFGSVDEHRLHRQGTNIDHDALSLAPVQPSKLVDVTQPPSDREHVQLERPPALFRNDGQIGILFDASDNGEDEVDDFGDFEHVIEGNASDLTGVSQIDNGTGTGIVNVLVKDTRNIGESSRLPTDLLDLDGSEVDEVSKVAGSKQISQLNLVSVGQLAPKHLDGDKTDDWDTFGDFEQDESTAAQQARLKPADTASQLETYHPDKFHDNWEPFDDSSLDRSKQPSSFADNATRTADQTSPGAKVLSTEDVRPTNIPPPAILLQVLPKIYQTVLTDLTSKDSTDASVSSSIIMAYTVSARLIAGRTLRWKRDPILAQSMRIGPASSKSSGMKLASIDKTESLKEEQEATEAVNAWSKHAHAFNAALAKAGKQRPLMSLSPKMVPKPGPAGAIRATHACGLCGMKRDERLALVDVDVEDSFGEFWTEHWGHADCNRFWYQYSGFLNQR